MKKICLGLCGVAAALLSGCAAGPQMQMALPGDSAEYNGYTVRVHYIDQGDLGKQTLPPPLLKKNLPQAISRI